ncbi:unnamed protein product [Arctia plantaginis]|uniref:Uncharacterized protein n=1 Tax=Arctia plantaginis TaxID=874455 RepID=A0A8S0ZIN2_ARCPL|nr:unnamed protein product [Arctia plantaginis]CAB3238576.1 unnamed protein product [Arctia plantaginis]
MRLCYGLALAILITGNVQASNDENAERTVIEDENADIKRFIQISHTVRRNSFIDITLNTESFEEKCYVRPPDGQLTQTDKFAMEGVQVRHKSNFVSCRITIGPMIEDLLGNWELCGKSTTTEEMRCQPINIIWDVGNGNPGPSPSPLQRQIHRVHIGDYVNVGVTNRRDMSTCHVVTPNGEDLVITPDMNYPHIERSSANPCSVVIKDITRDILGDWLIYGRFNQGILGFGDIRLPFTLELYYDVNAYNIISLENQAHEVKVGSDITVEVTHSVGTVETCIYISPSGLEFSSASDISAAPKGIQFRSVNDYGVCGITFTAVTEDMFGEWQIIGRFRNGNVIDEKRLTFNITEKAIVEDDINMLNQINHFALQDALVDISLNKESFEEKCYIRPPNGEFTKAHRFKMEGVTVQKKSNFVSCRVTIGTFTEDMFGLWTLCGKSLLSEEIRCQPANIALRTANWVIHNRAQFTHPVHFGGSVNSGVSEGGTVENCHVVTPTGEDLVLTSDVNYPHIKRVNSASVCSVVIENITEDMLGAWLIYGTFNSPLRRTEGRLPLIFNLFDENNPHAQAYNVTVLQNQNHLVHVGTNLTLEVQQRTGDRQDCIYTAPSGKIFSINDNNSVEPRGVHFSTLNTAPICQVEFNPITEEAVGEWQISLRFRNGVLFNEIRQTFRIIEEDPENPLQENVVRTVQYLTTQNINTKMNTSHRFTINSASIIQGESCHIIAPDGRQYAFIDGFNVPNVEIINEDFVECGVILHVVEENMIGTWTILGRARSLSDSIERRLPVTIRVEENFVLQNDIHIKEGSDLYLHLNEAITLPETCTLIGPDGNEIANVESDPIYASACGYIIRDVNQTYDGTWIIEYGARIKKRGSVNVQILDPTALSLHNLQWSIGDSVDISVGPENAVYCVIKDVTGNIVFDDFGQCKIVLDRVSVHHRGNWTMQIGKPGTVRLQSYNFYVEVHSVDGLPIVSTTVEENHSSLMLTCSVPARHEVHACKFRDPRGNILIAVHGVGQDNYMFRQATVNYVSNAHSHDCTLRLINPSVAELGIWRCGLDTSTGTHYGFLTVLPQNPGAASSVVTEPILRSTDVSYFEGDPVTLSCSISSALRYCYFRADNGTIYNVFPRMSRSENFEYVGAGLDAGDCGIRFKSLSTREGGIWSCHVGLLDTTAPELREAIVATISAKMSVNHFWDRQQRAIVEAFIHSGQAIEYCRFVRMDGEGFTSDNVPQRYTLEPLLHTGACVLNIWNPDSIDLQPWTIAIKLVEGNGEISMTTVNNQLAVRPSRSIFSGALFWLTIVFVFILILSVAGACFPKKNRDWTYRRASGLNQSVRSYFNKNLEKKPPMTTTQHA